MQLPGARDPCLQNHKTHGENQCTAEEKTHALTYTSVSKTLRSKEREIYVAAGHPTTHSGQNCLAATSRTLRFLNRLFPQNHRFAPPWLTDSPSTLARINGRFPRFGPVLSWGTRSLSLPCSHYLSSVDSPPDAMLTSCFFSCMSGFGHRTIGRSATQQGALPAQSRRTVCGKFRGTFNTLRTPTPSVIP